MFRHHKRLFSRYLFSYMTIIAIGLLVSTMAYYVSIRVIQEEITKGHNSSLIQVREMIDERLNKLEDIYIQFGFDEDLQLLMSKLEPFKPFERITLVKRCDDLGRYILSNKDIGEIYIYGSRNQFVLSSEGIYDLDLFLSSFSYGVENFTGWIEETDEGLVQFTYTERGGNKRGIAYIRQLPFARTQNTLGKFIIIIDEVAIEKTLTDMKWIPEASLSIVDEQGRSVVGDVTESTISSFTDAAIDGELISGELNDQVVSYIRSDINDWIYLSVIPRNVFFSRAKQIKNIIWGTLGGFMIIGVLISFFFARKYYSPMDRLVNYIQDHVRVSMKKDKDQDEYKFIRTILDNFITEKEHYIENENKLREKLKNEFYTHLLHGELDSKAIDELKALHGIELPQDGEYLILLFDVDESSMSPTFDDWADEEQYPLDMTQIMFSSVFGEIIGGKFGYAFIRIDGFIACLIRDGSGVSRCASDDIQSITEKTEDLFRNRFHVPISSATGGLQVGYEGIAETYRQAEEAMEYRVLMGGDRPVFYEDIHESGRRRDDFYYRKDIEKFTRCIRDADIENARNILDGLLQTGLQDCGLSMNLIRLRINELVYSFINALEELRILNGDVSHYSQTMDRLLQCKTISELRCEMEHILTELKSHLPSDRQPEMELYQRVIEYINDNYQFSEVNVNALADTFSVSSPYLSKDFKRRMGIGLLDYLQLIRVDKAKKLLENYEHSIKEIAKKVGFVNSIGLIRVFKKHEGITPGIYQKKQEEKRQ